MLVKINNFKKGKCGMEIINVVDVINIVAKERKSSYQTLRWLKITNHR